MVYLLQGGSMITNYNRRKVGAAASVVFALSISACGGSGGGVNSVPAAPPPPVIVTPPPPPPLPVTPSTQNFVTAEYRQSDGPAYHNAITAYQAGASGRGITVGVIDTGIDGASHEFAGRISPLSFDAAGSNRPLGDENGHGTAVSRVIAAAKDNRDVHGIAYNATILALRADTQGSCLTPEAGESEANCRFSDDSIAAGINRAIEAKARIINISLGGAGGINASLRSAVDRATKAGIVIIVSAGNERNNAEPEYDVNNPNPFAQALSANGNGLVIISTSVDENDLISDFSNLAGASRQNTLSALGDAVCCFYENDSLKITTENGSRFITLYAGTSFSAPQISGAAALLAQAFPNLTGKQIVDLLLSSARDVGTAGTDTTYGRGILDIARAFAPQGTSTLANRSVVVPLEIGAGTTSGAMGDAANQQGSLNAIILDSYGRAYDVDLANGLSARAPQLRLAPALLGRGRSVAADIGDAQLAFSLSDDGRGRAQLTKLGLNAQQQQGARVLAGRVSAAIAKNTRFSFGIRQTAALQIAALQHDGAGQSRSSGAFLAAQNAVFSDGLEQSPESSFAVRHDLSGFGITASAETGTARIFEEQRGSAIRSGYNAYRYNGLGLAIDRKIGGAKIAISGNFVREQDSILGARFASSFGMNGAKSLFVAAASDLQLAQNWTAAVRARVGWSRADRSAIITKGSTLKSNAFSFDLTRANAFRNGDQLALRISQPLRVSSGGLALDLPIAYDYTTQAATSGIRRFNLAPKGREIASELAWLVPFSGGSFTANLYWRQEPGHFEDAPDDVGAAFHFSIGF
jgi:subtilisin family serine protease